MRHQSATAHELARVALLAGLSGETLARLAERMERSELRPGERADGGDAFYVVLAGVLAGPRGMLRPGDEFTDARDVRAVTPATVASCDRATYEELVAPALADR